VGYVRSRSWTRSARALGGAWIDAVVLERGDGPRRPRGLPRRMTWRTWRTPVDATGSRPGSGSRCSGWIWCTTCAPAAWCPSPRWWTLSSIPPPNTQTASPRLLLPTFRDREARPPDRGRAAHKTRPVPDSRRMFPWRTRTCRLGTPASRRRLHTGASKRRRPRWSGQWQRGGYGRADRLASSVSPLTRCLRDGPGRQGPGAA
jgi:hypothetical protein